MYFIVSLYVYYIVVNILFTLTHIYTTCIASSSGGHLVHNDYDERITTCEETARDLLLEFDNVDQPQNMEHSCIIQPGKLNQYTQIIFCCTFNCTTKYDFEIAVAYKDIGDPSYNCEYCGAMFWFQERMNKAVVRGTPRYSLCCSQGKIRLPPPSIPPSGIQNLFFGQGDKSKHFLQHIRSYNSMFSFTSMGGRVDRSVNTGSGPPTFRLSGQNYHLIGSLLPQHGERPHFSQLYIYDTENEISNRIHAVR